MLWSNGRSRTARAAALGRVGKMLTVDQEVSKGAISCPSNQAASATTRSGFVTLSDLN